jgi:hypothetical protein
MKRRVTQVDAFNYFMSKKDFEMASDILCTEFTVENSTKEQFLDDLRNCTKEFSSNNDLVVVTGPCYCKTHQGLQGYSYIDTHNNVFLNLVIQAKDGNIVDIGRCNHFVKPKEYLSGRSICFSRVHSNCEIGNTDSVF